MSSNRNIKAIYVLKVKKKMNFLSQIFSEKAKHIETWFASKEAILANKDVGVS